VYSFKNLWSSYSLIRSGYYVELDYSPSRHMLKPNGEFSLN
jgi:hypothetical protein